MCILSKTAMSGQFINNIYCHNRSRFEKNGACCATVALSTALVHGHSVLLSYRCGLNFSSSSSLSLCLQLWFIHLQLCLNTVHGPLQICFAKSSSCIYEVYVISMPTGFVFYHPAGGVLC